MRRVSGEAAPERAGDPAAGAAGEPAQPQGTGRTRPESGCAPPPPPEGAEFTRNEWIGPVGAPLPRACGARSRRRARRTDPAVAPRRPASPGHLFQAGSPAELMAHGRGRCRLLALSCSFVSRALKPTGEKGGGEAGLSPQPGRRGCPISPGGRVTELQESHGAPRTWPWGRWGLSEKIDAGPGSGAESPRFVVKWEPPRGFADLVQSRPV